MKQYSRRNPQFATWLGGIAVGAMAMYLADPIGGKRRRLLVQEKMRTASARTGGALSQVMHGTGNRLSAAQYRAKDLMRRQALDDEGLHARVRNAVSRLTSIPSDIGIKAEQGCVTLSGLIAAKEKDRLLQKLRQMPGVHELRDHLAMRHDNRTRSFLSGQRQKTQHDAGETARMIEQKTAQTTASAGGAMIGAARRIPVGALLAIAGLGYAIQGMSRGKFRRFNAASTTAPQKKTIHLQKSIDIQASPETVFNIWSKYDNFPQFMSHLVEIQSTGIQQSHWTMRGPGGVNVEWDAVMTKYMEPTMLAWKTEPGSPIDHNGSVRFEASNGGTRATVRMYYRPAAGKADSLAALLSNDPEQELENDLMRMKTYIEGKNFPHEVPEMSSSSGQVLH